MYQQELSYYVGSLVEFDFPLQNPSSFFLSIIWIYLIGSRIRKYHISGFAHSYFIVRQHFTSANCQQFNERSRKSVLILLREDLLPCLWLLVDSALRQAGSWALLDSTTEDSWKKAFLISRNRWHGDRTGHWKCGFKILLIYVVCLAVSNETTYTHPTLSRSWPALWWITKRALTMLTATGGLKDILVHCLMRLVNSQTGMSVQ